MIAFQQGDARAFEVLAGRHQRGIYNFVLRSVRETSRAEELLQEVFLRVVRSKSRYQRTAKFSTWVYSIARNLCVDESRRARFRDHQSLDAERRGRNGEGGGPMVARIAAPGVPTDEAAEAPGLRKRLAAAIDRLPDEQREVFVMRQVSGMSFRDIGETLGVPENTIKSRMRYALEKLREQLGDLRHDAPLPAGGSSDRKGQAHV